MSNSFWSISIFFHCLDYWSTFSPWSFASKVGKKSPIKLWHQSTKISFWGCDNHYVFSSGGFHWRLCSEFCPGFETMNESVNALIAGCKLMTSAPIILFFYNSYNKPYNKQLNNLDRSVFTGKSQTSAYRILSVGQYGKTSVWDFPVTTSLSVLHNGRPIATSQAKIIFYPNNHSYNQFHFCRCHWVSA